MKLEMAPNVYVPAECSAVISPKDELAKDFAGTPSRFFSIEDFTFDVSISSRTDSKDAMELQDENAKTRVNELGRQVDDAVTTLHGRHQVLERRVAELEDFIARVHGPTSSASGSGRGRTNGGGGTTAAPAIKPQGAVRDSVKYARFMNDGRAALRNPEDRYPSDLDEVSITKRMDRSSTTLFDKCRQSFKFSSASVLRRKAIGTDILMGYLRIDFFDVMLTSLSWDDDDVIKERFKFVCRRAVIRYSVETPGTTPGSQGAATLTPVAAVEWSVMPTKK